jgi:hypothetical protein
VSNEQAFDRLFSLKSLYDGEDERVFAPTYVRDRLREQTRLVVPVASLPVARLRKHEAGCACHKCRIPKGGKR